jgi:hypothetical protein
LPDSDEQRNGREVLRRIERQLAVERLVGRHRHAADHRGMAVGIGAHHRFHADVGAGAGAVLHHDRLAEAFTQLGRQRPRKDVDSAARRRGHDEMQRPGRIGLGESAQRNEGEEDAEGEAGHLSSLCTLFAFQ